MAVIELVDRNVEAKKTDKPKKNPEEKGKNPVQAKQTEKKLAKSK